MYRERWERLPEVPLDQETYWREAYARNPDNFYVGNQLYRLLTRLGREPAPGELYGGFPVDERDDWTKLLRDRGAFAIIQAPHDRPEEIRPLLKRAEHYQAVGKEALALADYNRAIRMQPQAGQYWAMRSSVLATAIDDTIRDGRAALEDAQDALSLAAAEGFLRGDWIHARFLEVLAAAFAELGEFDTAVGVLRFPLEKASSKKFQKRYLELVAQYESGKPSRLTSNIMPANPLGPASPKRDPWFEDR